MYNTLRTWRWPSLLLTGALASASLNAQTPIWSDEFDQGSIDRSIWTNDVGGSGFGNGELQYYTTAKENAYVEDGDLVVVARREDYDGKQFTSARLKTLGRFAYKYGTLEARVKLPDVEDGLWPAFWTMGTNFGQDGWPRCGEMDIMEVGFKAAREAGTSNNAVSAAAHWWQDDGTWSDFLAANYSNDTLVTSSALNEDYHTYKLEWTPGLLKVSVDDIEYYKIDVSDPNLAELNDNPQFILLNLAVGGFNFVELPDPGQITADFPAEMRVDYIRLYENEFTELYFGADEEIAGTYGVFTETTSVDDQIDFAAETSDIFVWNGMNEGTATAAEGTEVLTYDVPGGTWWGMGLQTANANMTNYSNGYLNFKAKTEHKGAFKINVFSSAAAGSGVDLIPGEEEYGLVRDGEWHDVKIPLALFADVDFMTVKTHFSASGEDPGAPFSIAFDDIYWTEGEPFVTPENGSFGVYTETEGNKTAGEFEDGVNGDIFVWDNTLNEVETTPSEGSDVLSFTDAGIGWYGMGLTSRSPINLTAFDNADGEIHVSMKSSATSDFRIGFRSGNVRDIGQKWIWFRNGEEPYGFKRDGQWHDVVIPVSEIADEVDLSEVTQLFQFTGLGNISDIAFDDIYWSGGGDADKDDDDKDPPSNRAPVPRLSSSVDSGTAPLTVSFDASASSDADNDPLTYSWTFGDGGTATGASPNHTFETSGAYTVKLTVSDGELSASKQTTITVGEPDVDDPNTAPVALLSASPTTGVAPLASLFSGESSSDPEGDALTYAWDFGDGATAEGIDVSHTFTAAGSYTVALTVSDGELQDVAQETITVLAPDDNDYDDDDDDGDDDDGNDDDGGVGNENLALDQPITSASDEATYLPMMANDGNDQTRWSSAWYSPNWIKVDLGQSYDLRKVVVNWERAQAESYLVLTSDSDGTPDPASWTVLSDQSGLADEARIDELDVNGAGRYVALYATNKLHPWGYSIFEFEVYGKDGGADLAGRSDREQPATLYPNPVDQTLNVVWGQVQEGDRFEIVSQVGQRVMELPVTGAEQTLDVSDLRAGMYTLRISGSQSRTLRFVKR